MFVVDAGLMEVCGFTKDPFWSYFWYECCPFKVAGLHAANPQIFKCRCRGYHVGVHNQKQLIMETFRFVHHHGNDKVTCKAAIQ